MVLTKYQWFLTVLFITTGSINTIAAKLADRIESEGRDGKKRHFVHPFFQASCMFIGEFLCFLVFKVLYKVYSRRNDGSEDVHGLTKGNRDFNPFILFLPAICDMTATSIMYVALNLTYASSYQMFRGSVIIFVGGLSVCFLHRILKLRQWAGMILIIGGLATVGTADFLNKNTNAAGHGQNDIITGDLLIVVAQMVASVQFVVEEKFLRGSDIPPLQAVGWEGIFGFITLGCLQIPFYFIPVPPPFSNNSRGVLEDAIEAFVQIGNDVRLFFALSGTAISIAFFNFAGISITKELSATTRMVCDTLRTIVIWIFSLSLMGQKFHWLQLLGFGILLFGMALYSGILQTPFLKCRNACYSCCNKDLPEETVENLPA